MGFKRNNRTMKHPSSGDPFLAEALSKGEFSEELLSGKPTQGKTARRKVSQGGASQGDVSDGATRTLEHQVGLGVDIVEIARIAAVLQRTPRFKTRVYTADEQAYCEKTASPEIHYATRFAAKEAVLKALGTGFGWGTCDPRNVEVRRNVKGRPYVVLHGPVKEIAREQNITEIPLSLSYTHTDAVACVMAITGESVAPAPQEDPMAQLSRQFKELRSMLDDMDERGIPDSSIADDDRQGGE